MNGERQRISEIAARWQAATPGNWITTAGGNDPNVIYADEVIAVCDQNDPEIAGLHHIVKVDALDDRPDDLIFIAEAHQDVPFLLSVIEERDAEIAKWTELHKLNIALPERSEGDFEIEQLRRKVCAWESALLTNNPYSPPIFTPVSDDDWTRLNDLVLREFGHGIDRYSAAMGAMAWDACIATIRAKVRP